MAVVYIGLLIAGTTLWLAVDAWQRDWSRNPFANAAWKWALGSLLLWFVVFPLYLAQRNRVPIKV